MEVTRPAVSVQPAPQNSDLEVRLRKRFPNPERAFDLDAQFRASPGFTILFGASGAGKTTVLDSIAGFTQPDEGRVSVAGQELFDSEKRQNVPAWQRRIGYVIQDLALFPHLTAQENVAFGLHVLTQSERRQRSLEMLRTFGIEHLSNHRPAQISGGER